MLYSRSPGRGADQDGEDLERGRKGGKPGKKDKNNDNFDDISVVKSDDDPYLRIKRAHEEMARQDDEDFENEIGYSLIKALRGYSVGRRLKRKLFKFALVEVICGFALSVIRIMEGNFSRRSLPGPCMSLTALSTLFRTRFSWGRQILRHTLWRSAGSESNDHSSCLRSPVRAPPLLSPSLCVI